MNKKDRREFNKLHDKIDCVDKKFSKFLSNEWIHEITKTAKMATDISWIKKYFWVIIVALLGLLFKAFV